MKKSTLTIASCVWVYTWLVFTAGAFIYALWTDDMDLVSMIWLVGFAACIGSLPALLVLNLTLGYIRDLQLTTPNKLLFLVLLLAGICLLYGLVVFVLDITIEMALIGITVAGCLFACTLVSFVANYPALKQYLHAEPFPDDQEDQSTYLFTHQNQTIIMDTPSVLHEQAGAQPATSNKVLIKAAITGALILLMLIPALFITNLVQEREQRQRQVITEVSKGWAAAQTITGPYIVVPYRYSITTTDNKTTTVTKNIFLLPDDLQVAGTLEPQQRKRSIYTVLLYRANLQASGRFQIVVPAEINKEQLLLQEAKLCIGINDFKGIEEKVAITFNGTRYELTPGLPSEDLDKNGLSAGINLSFPDLQKPLDFSFNLKVKGSEQISFLPLSGNSTFTLRSAWPSPSFNGASLPVERQVSDSGFSATWAFNTANLPFNTFLRDVKFDQSAYAFGVSMLQPADQYAKTMRSVKYAILFIGLTFSLFFIVELMQQRPVHPVQYVLVGLALVIFYTLLLSISEFILFDYAYAIAAMATVSLITLYAKGHFKKWSVAAVFALVTGLLYTFIFILIRLEDTALLVGSIGLFTILALVMYASRNINWYNPGFVKNVHQA